MLSFVRPAVDRFWFAAHSTAQHRKRSFRDMRSKAGAWERAAVRSQAGAWEQANPGKNRQKLPKPANFGSCRRLPALPATYKRCFRRSKFGTDQFAGCLASRRRNDGWSSAARFMEELTSADSECWLLWLLCRSDVLAGRRRPSRVPQRRTLPDQWLKP